MFGAQFFTWGSLFRKPLGIALRLCCCIWAPQVNVTHMIFSEKMSRSLCLDCCLDPAVLSNTHPPPKASLLIAKEKALNLGNSTPLRVFSRLPLLGFAKVRVDLCRSDALDDSLQPTTATAVFDLAQESKQLTFPNSSLYELLLRDSHSWFPL